MLKSFNDFYFYALFYNKLIKIKVEINYFNNTFKMIQVESN